MKPAAADDELILSDSPGCYWLFGVVLVALGGVAVWLELGRETGVAPLALLMAGAAAVLGLAMIYRSPRTQVTANRAARRLTVRQRGLFPAKVQEIPFAEVGAVTLVERPRRGILPMYGRLNDGRQVMLTRLWTQDRARPAFRNRIPRLFECGARLEEQARRLRTILGVGKG